jgi:hypothetical protein
MKTLTISDEDYKKVQEVLEKATPVVEKKKGVTIYKTDGSVLFKSDKETIKEAVEERVDSGADLRGANLYGADLREANLYGADLREVNLYGADLREAELASAKFYGKGGTTKIKKSQLNDFLTALGIILED